MNIKKFDVEIYSSRGLGCKSDCCAFSGECANHYTAGEFRSESGFTPELIYENGNFFCKTIEEEESQESSIGSRFPANYNQLDSGCLILNNNKIIHYEEYAKMKNIPNIEQLESLRHDWEKNFYVIFTKFQLDTKGNLLVVLESTKWDRTQYRCHRYFPYGESWEISVDKENVNLPTAMKWLEEKLA